MALLPNLPSRHELKEEARRLKSNRDALKPHAESQGVELAYILEGTERALATNLEIAPSGLLEQVLEHINKKVGDIDPKLRDYVDALMSRMWQW